MSNIINISLINLNSINIIKLVPVTILVINLSDQSVLFEEKTIINYKLNNFLSKPEYFITTSYVSPNLLSTVNFYIDLDYGLYYYYQGNGMNTLYIYSQYLYIPSTFIGLINSTSDITTTNTVDIKTIQNTSSFSNSISNYFSNNFQNDTIIISGSALQITKYLIKDSSNISKNYVTYNLVLPTAVNSNLKVYIYDGSYCKIQNIKLIENTNPNRIDSINFMIQLLNTQKLPIYNYLVNLNYNKINFNTYDNLVIFFTNFATNIVYDKILLYVFDYDYNLFFKNLSPTDYDKCDFISISDATLYDKIIKNDSNLITPTIPTLSIDDYLVNIDKIKIINTLFFNKNTTLVTTFLKSYNNNIDLLIDFLYNFNIKSYNFFNIKTNYSTNTTILNLNNFLLNGMLMFVDFKFNSLVETDDTYIVDYNLYSKLLNNNNTIDLYHKNYTLTETDKKQLIKDFIIIIMNYFRVDFYFYNDITDLNNTLSIFKNTIGTNPYFKFNRFILNKPDVLLYFDYDEYYSLKLFIEINISYKILVFNNNTITDTILNFQTDQYFFQIFKIPTINGNINNLFNVFYIVFMNIKECNEFFNYITNGKLYADNDNLNSFYAIDSSMFFKKNTDTGYYQITEDTSGIIYFNINDIDLNSSSIFKNNFIKSVV